MSRNSVTVEMLRANLLYVLETGCQWRALPKDLPPKSGRVLCDGPFENLWIQPAAGDAGGALGIALAISNMLGKCTTTCNRITLQRFGPRGAHRLQGA